MELFGTALLVIGGFILLVGLISGLVKSRFWVTEPLLAFLLQRMARVMPAASSKSV